MRKRLVVALAAALSVAGVAVAPALADQEIVVQPGESLQSISQRYYGDEVHIERIAAYNRLASPDMIYAGLHLVLPDLSLVDDDELRSYASASSSVAAHAAAAASRFGQAIPSVPLGGPAAPAATFVLPASNAPGSPGANQSAAPGVVIQSGLATWYGPGFDGNITYCGDVYDEWAYTAASNTLPCGMIVVVTNQENGASVRVRINDRGGFGGAVILDLSRAAFSAIGSWGSGVVAVTVSEPAQ